MEHPLQKRITAVWRSARRTSLVYGLCWSAVVVVASLLVAGALDYFLRVEYQPVRILITTALAIAVGWGLFRFLLPQLVSRGGSVAVAQRVQQRFPKLKDKLASAVEFLNQSDDDPLAGSAALRRAVVAQAAAEVEQLELREVVTRKPAVRALFGALIVAAIAAAVVLASPATSRTALARLINPLGDHQWPKRNKLVFVDPPTRIASGSLFDVDLIDENNHMPDQVFIDYRFADEGEDREVAEPMQFVNERGKEKMVANRDNVRRPFSYRARGGDDETPWYNLEVLEPPRVESVQVTLTPPAYSGWPVTESPGRIMALVGTTVEVKASVTKPLKSASLVLGEGKQKIVASLSDDKLQLTIPATDGSPWRIEENGTYSFELVDTDDITGGATDKWQIRAIADEPPTVNIEKPVSELHVTPAATVPIRVLVKDRLAIKQIALNYTRSDASDTGEQTVKPLLYEGPEKVAPISEQQLAERLNEGHRELVEQQWQLAALDPPLTAGTIVEFHAAALDYQPTEGKSPTQRLIVVSDEELLERLERQQASILGDLARVLTQQKEARARTTELEIQFDEVGHLADQDVPKLQGLGLAQRDVRHALTAPREGVLDQIGSLLNELEDNKLDSPEMARRLGQLGDLIRQLDREKLPGIESELINAEKSVQSNLEDRGAADQTERGADVQAPPKGEDEPRTSNTERPTSNIEQERNAEAQHALNKAGELQDATISDLEAALGDLQRWDNYRRFAREIAGIENDQRQLQQDTDDMGKSTLGRVSDDLTPQQRADLKKIAEKQKELARQFDKVAEGMQKAAENLADDDPLAADSIADALHQAATKAIGSRMRAAGQNVSQNQVEQATGRQQDIANDLQEMLDTLANRREQELSRLVKKLKEAEAELEGLRKEQAGLQKKIKDAEKIENEEERRRELQRLAKQQRKMQEDIDRLARQLRRLQANRASDKLNDASNSLGQSSDSGEAGDAGQSGQQAEQAKRDLEDAQQQLAKARKQAEADLAQEQIARMEDQLKAVVARQQQVIDETQRLETLREEQGRLTRGQKASVTQLAGDQSAVRDETQQMAEKLAGAEVFRRALDGAAGHMEKSAERLGQFDTGGDTQRIEEQALARLALVMKALGQDKEDGQDDKQGGGGAGQGGGNQGQGGQIRDIAELKLLKLLQEELNLRTDENGQAIAERLARGEAVDELIDERTALAREQGQLADIMFDMLETADNAPEDDPDKLPDVESDGVDRSDRTDESDDPEAIPDLQDVLESTEE